MEKLRYTEGMEISCPSCGQKHSTEDYPGAFEIPCSCGHSILVPDAESEDLSPDSLDPAEPYFKAPPLSFESQDEALALRSGSVKLSPEDEELLRSADLTSPDDLPDAMPYDPFELSDEHKVKDISEEVADINDALEDVEDPTSDKLGPSPRSKDSTKMDLIDRLQSASMGRFYGSSYTIEIHNLDAPKVAELKTLIDEFLSHQAWLAEELERRGIRIHQALEEQKVDNLPETVAVEIYLRCYELGGLCRFEKTDLAPDL